MLSHPFKLTGVLFSLFFSTPLIAESEQAVTLGSYYGARHIQKNKTIKQNDEIKDQGGVKLNFHLTPIFEYKENIQFDYLIDVNMIKSFERSLVDIDFNETYIDLLFYERVGVKMGVSAIDYGNNSYFHPLQVVEFIPELKARYGRQFFGVTDLGYRGVPSLQARLKLPSFYENVNLTIRQSEIFLGIDLSSSTGDVAINSSQSITESDVIDKKIYSVSDLGIVYKSFDFNILGGYIDQKKPVWGGSISYLFPLQIMGYAEILYRKESFRPKIQNGVYSQWEKGSYYNASIGASASFNDPLTKNPVRFQCEVFYYGEGFDGERFMEVKNFFQYEASYTYYYDLIQKERNFLRNGMISIMYTIPQYRLSFQEKVVGSVYATKDPGSRYSFLASNEFYISKAYDSATISVVYLYNSTVAADSFVYQGSDESIFLTAEIIL